MGIRQANKKITLFFLHEIPKSTIKINVHTMKITYFCEKSIKIDIFCVLAADMVETKGKLGAGKFR